VQATVVLDDLQDQGYNVWMSSYAARALAIRDIATDLRHRMEWAAGAGTIGDRMVVIDAGVEIVNKLLYCFLVNQELFDSIETSLNRHYRSIRPTPSSINVVFFILMSVVLRFERRANEWVVKYDNN